MNCCDEIHASWISLRSFFLFDFPVILNPVLNGLMILISIDSSNLILFSTNYKMYIVRDTMCDLSVPLTFLSRVL